MEIVGDLVERLYIGGPLHNQMYWHHSQVSAPYSHRMQDSWMPPVIHPTLSFAVETVCYTAYSFTYVDGYCNKGVLTVMVFKDEDVSSRAEEAYESFRKFSLVTRTIGDER